MDPAPVTISSPPAQPQTEMHKFLEGLFIGAVISFGFLLAVGIIVSVTSVRLPGEQVSARLYGYAVADRSLRRLYALYGVSPPLQTSSSL